MPITRRALLSAVVGTTAGAQAQSAPTRGWPRFVIQPEIFLAPAGKSAGGTVFASEHYDFWVESELSQALMQEFARSAEGIHRLWHALPLDLPPAAPDSAKARVEIWKTEATYQKAGGLPRTAGIFRASQRDPSGKLLVNAESLGVDQFHGRTSKGYRYQPSVLLHELSHQVTARWLHYLPLWMREGLAEYGALIPYNNGTFRLDADALRSALQRRAAYYRSSPDEWQSQPQKSAFPPSGSLSRWIVPFPELSDQEKVMALIRSPRLLDPHRVYWSALLTCFFLLHLDTPQNGQRPFQTCLAAISQKIREIDQAREQTDRSSPLFQEPPLQIGTELLKTVWGSRSPAEIEQQMQEKFSSIGLNLRD